MTAVGTEGAVGTSGPAPARRTSIGRLVRYGATSVVAFTVSEITLLVLYGFQVTGATLAAVAANLAGTVPSYLMSRYWIWSESPRARVGRQVVLYWTISLVCIAGTSIATGAITRLAPSGHRFHLAVAGIGFLVVNVVFWIGKFAVYQRVVFTTDQPAATVPGRAGLPVASANGEPRRRLTQVLSNPRPSVD